MVYLSSGTIGSYTKIKSEIAVFRILKVGGVTSACFENEYLRRLDCYDGLNGQAPVCLKRLP